MLNKQRFVISCLTVLLAGGTVAKAEPVADACVSTGIDNSPSMYYSNQSFPHNLAMTPVLRSLAKTLADPGVQALLTSGPTGHTRFGIYLWGTATRQEWLTPAVNLVRNNPAGMQPVITALHEMANGIEADAKISQAAGNTTALSRWNYSGTHVPNAVGFGLDDLVPAKCQVKILNILTDDHNARPGSLKELQNQQLRAKSLNITINGLIVGEPDAKLVGVEHYFHTLLKIGPRSFVLKASDYLEMDMAWRRKFELDMAAMTPPTRWAFRQ
jgi:hypothetical protein